MFEASYKIFKSYPNIKHLGRILAIKKSVNLCVDDRFYTLFFM